MIKMNLPINQYSDDFKEWLSKNMNLSDRARNDCFSRCRRVERDLKINIRDYLTNKQSYRELLIKVKKYSEENSNSKSSQHILKVTLRGAIKKYAIYSYPENSQIYNQFDYKRID